MSCSPGLIHTSRKQVPILSAQSRREFLKTSAVFGSVLILPGKVLAKGAASPNNRLNHATPPD